MAGCHHYEFVEGNEQIFAEDLTAIRFGPGALAEVGHDAKVLSLSRVAVFSDKMVAGLEVMETVKKASSKGGVDFELFDEIRIEPADQCLLAARGFAREGNFDG